jgi:hypothetical protein
MRLLTTLLFASTCVLISACSGGELLGINSHPAPNPTPKAPATSSAPSSSPTASASASSQMAVVTGKVVDFDSNQPLIGVSIKMTPLTGTAYMSVAESASDGTFSFTIEPGSYVIAVGSNSPSDSSRATEHDVVALSAGSNALAPLEPSPVPNYTLAPSETSGNFRLAQLSSAEQSCLAGMNRGRSSNGLSQLVEDEEQLEFDRAEVAEEVAQNTDEPTPMFSGGYTSFDSPTGEEENSTDLGLTPCSAYSDGYTFSSAGSETNGYAFNSAVTWYAGAYGVGSQNPYEAQGWLIDPSTSSPNVAAKRRNQIHIRRKVTF